MPSLIFYGLNAFTLVSCLFALWKGSAAERWGAGLIIANIVLGELRGQLIGPDLTTILKLAIDGATALALLAVAVRYASPWLGAVMLLYGAQFALHSFYFVTDRSPDYFKAVANNVVFFWVSACLLIGTMMAWRGRLRARRASSAAA